MLAIRGKASHRTVRAGLRAVWLASAAALLLGSLYAYWSCKRHTTARHKSRVPLDVVFSGCAAVLRGPICALDETKSVRVVVPGVPSDRPTFSTEHAPANVLSESLVSGGRRYVVRVPEGARRLWVRVDDDGRFGEWQLELAAHVAEPWLDKARALREQGQVDEAEALAAKHAGDGGVAEAWAKGILARISIQKGQYHEAASLFRQSVALHEAQGRISDAAGDRFAWSFVLSRMLHAYGEARTVLDSLRDTSTQYPDVMVEEPFYRAHIAHATGDRRGEIELFRSVEEKAQRVGWTTYVRYGQFSLASAIADLGGYRDARKRLIALGRDLDATVPACEKADIWVATASTSSEILEADSGDDSDLESIADDSERLLRVSMELIESSCQSVYRRANALLELTRLRLWRHDLLGAAQSLAHARASLPSSEPEVAVEGLFLEGRTALESHDWRSALRAFRKMDQYAERLGWIEQRVNALGGCAAAQEGLGYDDIASKTYAEVERVLDNVTIRIPLGEGRSTFNAARQAVLRRQAELLIRHGKPEAALAAVQRMLDRGILAGQLVRQLAVLDRDARQKWEHSVEEYRRKRATIERGSSQDWMLPEQEWLQQRDMRHGLEEAARRELEGALAALQEDAVVHCAADSETPVTDFATLTYIFGRTGGLGFMSYGNQVRAARLPLHVAASSPEQLAHTLLDPFKPDIEKLERLRVLAVGPFAEVDLHALPWGGGALMNRFSLVYGTHGYHEALGPLLSISPTHAALIVTDPSGNLPSAHREAEVVDRLLRSQGIVRVHRLSQDQATSSAVLQALQRADIFHFAGHAKLSTTSGWGSEMELADGGHITAADILSLSSVPRLVVLMACEGARPGADGVGIAQAFLSKGTRVVIAPTRKLSDAIGLEFTRLLYVHLAESEPGDFIGAFHQALRRLQSTNPDSDWAALRVLVP